MEQGKLYVRDYKDDDAKKEVLPANRVVPTLRQLHQSKRTLDKRQFQAYALSQYAIGKDHVAELFGHSEVHQRGRIPHAYQRCACVSCVPGSPRYPHPLTRLCVWRLPPARLLVDPGVPGSTFHTPPRAGCSR